MSGGGKRVKIEKQRLVLVEGTDDESFFSELLGRVGRADVQVLAYQGKDNLRPFLALLRNDPKFQELVTLAVTRDADYFDGTSVRRSAPAAAFDGVCDVLRGVGLSAPNAAGAVTTGAAPATAVYVLPDNASPGMLEDLVFMSFADAPIGACVQTFLTCAAAAGHLPVDAHRSKQRMYAVLATWERFENRLGLWVKQNPEVLDHAAFAPLREFLKVL